MSNLNRVLVQLTGFSIHSSKNMLSALTDGKMSDYIIECRMMIVNSSLHERRVFRVTKISDVVEHRLCKLLRNKIFVPSSRHTLLEDSTIIVRLGGDKGGNTMAFKFGLTVMNCPKPNLPESFDLIATMEAFDTYTNLRDAIFQYYKDELDCFCKVSPEHVPTVLVLLDSNDVPLWVRLIQGFGRISSPLTRPIIVLEADD